MKTNAYNPSDLERSFADALEKLRSAIEAELPNSQIRRIENNKDLDNPVVRFHLRDADGDEHQLVVKIIQVPDSE